MVKTIIQVVLAIVILAMAYFVFESIMKPIRFNKEEKIRQDAVISRLKDIREAQIAFKAVNKHYASTFDSLLQFIENGKFAMVLKIGNAEDSTAKIIRDTMFVSVKDSIFKKKENFVLDSLPYIPYSGGKKFNLRAKQVEKGRVMVSVFCASANNKDFMGNLDKNMYDEEDSVYVGSLEEPTTDGSWD